MIRLSDDESVCIFLEEFAALSSKLQEDITRRSQLLGSAEGWTWTITALALDHAGCWRAIMTSGLMQAIAPRL